MAESKTGAVLLKFFRVCHPLDQFAPGEESLAGEYCWLLPILQDLAQGYSPLSSALLFHAWHLHDSQTRLIHVVNCPWALSRPSAPIPNRADHLCSKQIIDNVTRIMNSLQHSQNNISYPTTLSCSLVLQHALMFLVTSVASFRVSHPILKLDGCVSSSRNQRPSLV